MLLIIISFWVYHTLVLSEEEETVYTADNKAVFVNIKCNNEKQLFSLPGNLQCFCLCVFFNPQKTLKRRRCSSSASIFQSES